MFPSPHDPNEMARKLQSKLASLDSTPSHSRFRQKKLRDTEADNISICSSRSFNSENENRTPSNNRTVDRITTPHKTHGDSKGLGFEFGNSSFASIPYSLPPCLDYQFPVHVHGEAESVTNRATNARLRELESSLASREDLQCNWESGQVSRQESITTHDVDPLNLIKTGTHILIKHHNVTVVRYYALIISFMRIFIINISFQETMGLNSMGNNQMTTITSIIPHSLLQIMLKH